TPNEPILRRQKRALSNDFIERWDRQRLCASRRASVPGIAVGGFASGAATSHSSDIPPRRRRSRVGWKRPSAFKEAPQEYLWSPPAIAMVARPTPSHKSRDHIIRNIGNKQASKVIEEFRHMSFKCRHAEPCKPGEEHLSIDSPGYKKKLFVELHLRTLPQLREQITNLSQSLDPHAMLEDPCSQLKLISAIQEKVHNLLDDVSCAVYWLCPHRSKYPSIGRNDQHMEEFKPYRLHGLYHQLSEFLLDHIMDLSHQACELIEQLDLSMDTYFG
ncbi:hypothetical protein PSTT_12063, partial [Puccinia striiformis]